MISFAAELGACFYAGLHTTTHASCYLINLLDQYAG